MSCVEYTKEIPQGKYGKYGMITYGKHGKYGNYGIIPYGKYGKYGVMEKWTTSLMNLQPVRSF